MCNVVKELKKKIHNHVNHDTEMDKNSKCINELIDIRNAITHFLYDYSKKGSGLKILTLNQTLSRLPISLAQLKAGNNSEKLDPSMKLDTFCILCTD